MIVVYGATSSGKSRVAENIALRLSKENKKLIYLATMEKKTEAARKRIEHHKKLRSGKGFFTIEEEVCIRNHESELCGNTVLIECVSNYVANIIFDRFHERILSDTECSDIATSIADEIINLKDSCNLVVVTNNVFGDYVSDEWCDAYMRVLGLVNRYLADACDTFVEVVAGMEIIIKGECSWL